jgi:phage terminase large subunit-like protein
MLAQLFISRNALNRGLRLGNQCSHDSNEAQHVLQGCEIGPEVPADWIRSAIAAKHQKQGSANPPTAA